MSNQKKCSRCKKLLELNEFHLDKTKDDGHSHCCKKCKLEHFKEWKSKNLNKYRKYHRTWKKLNPNYNIEYRKINLEREKKRNREYNKAHKEILAEQMKVWREKNKDHVKKYSREYTRNKCKRDINYSLKRNLRVRLNEILRERKINKTISATKLIGCTVLELKNHLESLFLPGMTWGNRGINGWHIDHIKPISLFDLTNPDQQKQCFHYTNLQPLWAKDNIKKSNTYAINSPQR